MYLPKDVIEAKAEDLASCFAGALLSTHTNTLVKYIFRPAKRHVFGPSADGGGDSRQAGEGQTTSWHWQHKVGAVTDPAGPQIHRSTGIHLQETEAKVMW